MRSFRGGCWGSGTGSRISCKHVIGAASVVRSFAQHGCAWVARVSSLSNKPNNANQQYLHPWQVLNDLLDPSRTNLKLREDAHRGLVVSGAAALADRGPGYEPCCAAVGSCVVGKEELGRCLKSSCSCL